MNIHNRQKISFNKNKILLSVCLLEIINFAYVIKTSDLTSSGTTGCGHRESITYSFPASSICAPLLGVQAWQWMLSNGNL